MAGRGVDRGPALKLGGETGGVEMAKAERVWVGGVDPAPKWGKGGNGVRLTVEGGKEEGQPQP